MIHNLSIWLLPFFAVACEYIQLQIPILIPFNLLGNYLGFIPIIIQWYEFTGVLGGSLWVYFILCLVWKAFFNRNHISTLIIVIFIPIIISLLQLKLEDFGIYNKLRYTIIQPNIKNDHNLSNDNTLYEIKSMVESICPVEESDILLLPETVFDNININNLVNNKYIVLMNSYAKGLQIPNTIMGVGLYNPTTLLADNAVYKFNNYYNCILFVNDEKLGQIYFKNESIKYFV